MNKEKHYALRVIQMLDSSLLKRKYLQLHKRQEMVHHLTGHCYVASEALYHLLGGREAGYKPYTLRIGDDIHWWIQAPDGRVLDLTAAQFGEVEIDYSQGRARGFLTRKPSRRARILIDRVIDAEKEFDLENT